MPICIARGPRSHFDGAFKRNDRETTTLTTIDVAEHALRRKRLGLCFSEKSIRAASSFVVRYVDRWIDFISEEDYVEIEWSSPVDLTEKIDALIFDIMTDLSFEQPFEIKEPGESFLKQTPHNITAYIRFYYLACFSPPVRCALYQVALT
ncbi:hypothetical protein F4818DRAFT_170306 [Hypoxylon cercidicola]|nr:hypothetical protein F4818DRAFT_170306 [Hypoxylon cercidicola]